MTGYLLRIYMLMISVLAPSVAFAFAAAPDSTLLLSDVNIEQTCSVEYRQTSYFIEKSSTGEKYQAVKDTVIRYFLTLDVPDVMLAYQNSVLTKLYHRQCVLLSFTTEPGFTRFRVNTAANEEDLISYS
ncbi:MAG: hypothetical protein HRT35_04850 [Algicola sp.]|nr:hypothetical protein [Algicola sp.]